jgi:MFS family permease
MALLIVWRVVQGAAMGAVVMCARAIVRDLYHPLEGARVMSKGLSGLGVLACICAPLGGLLSELYGWRIALAALAVFGAATLALVGLRFEESLAQKNPQGPAARHAAAHLAADPAQPHLPGLLGADGGLLRRAVHLPGDLLLRLHPGAGPEQNGLRPGDVFDVFLLPRRHLHLPAPAAALSACGVPSRSPPA